MNSLSQIRKFSKVVYHNNYFWIKNKTGTNIYDFGIKQNLINEKGHLKYLKIYDQNPNFILSNNFEIGQYIIDDQQYQIVNPIENSNIINVYDININKINEDPENLNNSIARFEIKNDILRETYYKYFR